MFAMQNQLNNTNEVYSLQTKSPKDMGARGLRKLNSFPRFHYIWLVLQRAPSFIHSIFFKMQNRKKNIVPKSELNEMKAQIAQLNPQLRNIKVQSLIGYKHVLLRAKIGCRCIYLKSGASNAMEKFIAQYQEKLETAF